MRKQPGRRPSKSNRIGAGAKKQVHRVFSVWVQLPASVVEARAGLIPELDSTPPPPGLSARQRSQWHRGLPVLYKGRQRAPLQACPDELIWPDGADIVL